MTEGMKWGKKTAAHPTRDFTDDDEGAVPRLTAVQKSTHLDMMLGQIANYCSVISRNSIIKNSVSLTEIWQRIRQHYGFQSSGAHLLDIATVKLGLNERPEDLYQRVMAFIEDNLMTVEGGLSHHGAVPTTDEDMSPTLENLAVIIWLQLVHAGLPSLVRQKYGAELRNKSIASIRPEISQALQSLLDELSSLEEVKVMRTFDKTRKPFSDKKRSMMTQKSCTLCKAAGRPSASSHFLSECSFLPDGDRRAIARSRNVQVDEDDSQVEEPDTYIESASTDLVACRAVVKRVNTSASPSLTAFCGSHTVILTVDSGAEVNMIRTAFARRIGLQSIPSTQRAMQADGVTPMKVSGEVHTSLARGQWSFSLDALVVDDLDVDVLAGHPFMVVNDIALRPSKQQLVIGGSEIINYGTPPRSTPGIRRLSSSVLRSGSNSTVVLPGQYIELVTPDGWCDKELTVEPRLDSKCSQKLCKPWPPPQVVSSVGNTVRLGNDTDGPIVIRKHEHVCQVVPLIEESDIERDGDTTNSVPDIPTCSSKPYANLVSVDPDNILTATEKRQFFELHEEFDEVFNPAISEYNGASGSIKSVVNMGPVLPPQRKGRLPQYNKNNLAELQAKFDELESLGVFAKPEDVGVNVEYLNPSFLVKKPAGGYRLVTAFSEVGQYSKPSPALMPRMDDVLRDMAAWTYLIKADLLKSFFQIPLAKESMKFCGVVTPYKGVRVYTRSAMGMPGSETALEELMSRVLGELVYKGAVTKIADDLYCGGRTVEEALSNWRHVLHALFANNLRLSASKTIICPTQTTVLGWIWKEGTISASPHRISALASCSRPGNVTAMRSFIGSFKALSRVLKGYATLLHPLEAAIAGKSSRESIAWSDDLCECFDVAQKSLSLNKVITLPRESDSLVIVTDGSVKCRGIGAAMYVLRDGKQYLGGFFNAKLRKHQVTWLPCEIEAVCIGAAVKHFSPLIIQSSKQSRVLTDSKPCVEAYRRLCRGEFSSSSRVGTFLAIVSRFQVSIDHIPGNINVVADFASRNPQECSDKRCQICTFIANTEDSVVRSVCVQDITDGRVSMPFVSRAAWHATQTEDGDLRRVHAHLTQGTRPNKKQTNISDVRRYLRHVKIARDGLLVVELSKPFLPTTEKIVVPRSVLPGLLTALHLRLLHPPVSQLRQLFSRYFFALCSDSEIQTLTASCHVCASLKKVPTEFHEQSSSVPDHIGRCFAADVLKRNRQNILVVRETVSSFTKTMLIDDEKSVTLRAGILSLCAEFVGEGVDLAIRVDPGPGFASLVADAELLRHGIRLQVGRHKNVNKNPVAESAIGELGLEMLRYDPEGGQVSGTTLALITSMLNSRIRGRGLSAREIWTQRDQFTGEQLPIADSDVIRRQVESRERNHASSALYKARGKLPQDSKQFVVGDLVYITSDRSKCKARERYLVVYVQADGWCKVRKFTTSQFRSKTYDVKMSECYPVLSECAQLESPRSHDAADSGDDTDEEYVDKLHGQVPGYSYLYPDCHEDVVDEDESIMDEYESQACDVEVAEEPRRSTRSRRAPDRLIEEM